MPEKVEGFSFSDMIRDHMSNQEEARRKEFEEAKRTGKCLHCGENPIDVNNPGRPHPFHCDKCNEETESILNQLRQDPGFLEFRM